MSSKEEKRTGSQGLCVREPDRKKESREPALERPERLQWHNRITYAARAERGRRRGPWHPD